MTSNGTAKTKKPRPQSELELATMRHCRNLIMRLRTPEARIRVVQYLQGATLPELETTYGEPASIDPPNQLKIPGTQDEELPFE